MLQLHQQVVHLVKETIQWVDDKNAQSKHVD
jgi:hypothetical protein